MAGPFTSFTVTPLIILRRTTLIQTFRSLPCLSNNNFSQRKVQFLCNPANFPSVAGLYHLVHASKGDSSEVLIKGVVDKNVLEDVRRVLEMANRASLRREIVHTDFLTPPVLKESMHALEKLADVKAVAQGGYPQAERCRLSVGHSEAMATTPDIVEALSVTGNFGLQPCSHSHFLGAILGTGIAREKLGDILLQGEKGAQILIIPELVDFLVTAMDKVGNVPVTCTRIPLLALEYAPPRTKTFKTVEASLRLDAVASAGYKISRSKLVDLISKGDVRINWSPVTKNGTTLKTGDMVSVSGHGRLKIGEISTTRKGKFAVEVIQFYDLQCAYFYRDSPCLPFPKLSFMVCVYQPKSVA